MILVRYPQERHGPEIIDQITALENTAWPGIGKTTAFPSAPDTHVTSFVLIHNGSAICHVGVRKSVLSHRGQTYLAYGLSEVVTHPYYQRRGIASRIIRAAVQFMTEERADISIFTCEKSRVPFYTRCGWSAVKGACLVGGTREKPFRSDSLGLVTMIRWISEKGKNHYSDFEQADLILELGENELW